MTNPPNPPPGPTLHSPEGLETVYTNLARIAHSPADIVIDFAHLLPGEKTAKVNARVLMSPLSAKLLLRALADNISRYEAAFGEIHVPVNSSLAENLFRPHQPPEPPKEDKK
ncbi:MAG: DUF3467 domain-containing protein [Anaerolineales bacterium]|nr:DUF3467 domain-containing protein [Anaerolineales bacterium]